MPNTIDATGVTIKTQAELIADYTAAMTAIYPGIDLDPDSSDGQEMNIQIQATLDQEDRLLQLNSSFDPDQAVGAQLDSRCAMNGIQRQAGTFTLQNISMIFDRALDLPGLDGSINDPAGTGYTVTDNNGTQWILSSSQVVAGAGTFVYQFRAKNQGPVVSLPNTITTPVTVILGVLGVNNPTTFTSLGQTEETDAQLRIRRQKSVSLGGSGFVDNMLAALENVVGVTAAFVNENTTDAIDGDGTSGHSVWCIVNGGAPADIAAAIYSKRSGGCGMRGSVTHTVTQLDGTFFIVKWDIVTPQNLYIQIHVTPLDGITSIDTAHIAAQLVLLLTPGVNGKVNINELSTIIQGIDPNCLVVPTVGDGFSLAAIGPFTNTLIPSSKADQFAVIGANISITVI